MDIRDRRGLKNTAAQALAEASYCPKKLILIHTGASLALSLVVMLLDFALSHLISGTGGLSGLSTRSALTTVQSVLQLVQMVVLPFWQMGWLYASIKMIRTKDAVPSDLLAGFRNFAPVLRLYLMQTLLYSGIVIACCYLGSFLYLMTPWSRPLMEQFLSISDPEALVAAMEGPMMDAAMPMMGICLVLILIIGVPVFYRFRLAEYLIMDGVTNRAMAALFLSRQLMRGNAMSLFKLDLSYWWFYLLASAVSTLAYLDVLLTAAGVVLPWSMEVSYFAAIVLSALGQLLLYWRCKSQLDAAYALVYDALIPKEAPSPTQE